ncbi:MAG: DNA polymerase I [Desulfobacterales bacterium]|nr:DNA polymerase I [Desulfobacterales bacterium]MDD4073158.1 DNA polymerase I [Desulfobacterales bacterium]MDD4392522.1 DNA polymerase I [Desulfobacterales bacterium]
METKKTLYLIDGSAFIHRAFHAIRNLSNSKGLPTNAVFGFTRMLMKLIEDRSPAYVLMVFDAKGPTFRHEIYSQYKANRPPMPDALSVQIPYIKEVTRAFNIPLEEKTGFEADDLIGTLSRQAEQSGFSVVMVTGDKDFMQLVTADATIWDPMKDRTVSVDSIRTEYGLEPGQMIDVMGLSGDSSDNIPGVPGIGPKTALSLIQSHGSIDGLYEHIDSVSRKNLHDNLIRHEEQARLSRHLVVIDTDVPVQFDPDACKMGAPNADALYGLFKELEFKQLCETFSRPSDQSQKQYHAVMSESGLTHLIDQLKSAGLFALDTETTSVNPMRADLVGLSFSTRANEAFYIPCAHRYPGAPEQLDLKYVLSRLQPVLENPDIKKIGQNIKYDWIVLSRNGIRLCGVLSDTMVASYLIDPSKRAHNLDQIALDFLDYRKISYQEVAGKGKNASGFEQVPVEKAVPYACEDADITLMAYHELKPRLEKLGLSELMNDVEMPLIPVLMKMEMKGICVDSDRLRSLSKTYAHELEQLEERIYAVAGEKFNIRSSQQLGCILFEKLRLPVQKKTRKKTGYSTDVDVLKTLASGHELPALLLRYRELAKLKSTYTDALLELIHPETGRIHTSYNQTVTATGRLSSSDPNLQNIPIRSEDGKNIRRAFIPREGWRLLSADYSQIELRILAHYSDDEILIDAFLKDEDIHTRTANEVFQVFPSMITDELRRQAKVINFGIIYGMSPFSLSRELGISQKMAKTYIDNYFRRYKGVKRFIDQTIEDAGKTGQTSTLLGRIRLLPDINSSNRTVRQFAERIAINTPIQGTAADLLKLAMIKVDAEFRSRSLQSSMLLTVHDELIFEVPPDELAAVKTLVKDVMEGVWEFKVPLKVNIDSGKNWAEAH